MSERAEYEIKHAETIRGESPECMVLLKSDGSFPLTSPCDIACFGEGVRHTIKGGNGSGDVNVRSYSTVEQGLLNAGFNIVTSSWLDAYEKLKEESAKSYIDSIKNDLLAGKPLDFMSLLSIVPPAPKYDLVLECSKPTDTCVYVVSRNSGEGKDRKEIPGDFELTEEEIRDIKKCSEIFKKFMLVLNVGGPLDLSPVLDFVPNILLLSQLGSEMGDAFADVVLGKSYPSGKLSASWAPYSKYPKEACFGGQDDTNYGEGIYVGYRYFGSKNIDPTFGFGYGLSYSDFSIEPAGLTLSGNIATARVNVANVGDFKGKDIVQLYVTKPTGKLDQPAFELVAFCKTEELDAGNTTCAELKFDVRDLKSYDDSSNSFIMESGDYILSVCDNGVCGNAKILPFGVLELNQTTTVEKVEKLFGDSGFDDLKIPQRKPFSTDELSRVPHIALDALQLVADVVEEPKVSIKAAEIAKSLTDDELAKICVGNFEQDKKAAMIGNAATLVVGAAGQTVSLLKNRGVKTLVMSDGPAGLRLNRVCAQDDKGKYSLEPDAIMAMLTYILPEPMLQSFGVGHDAPNPIETRGGKVYEQNCSAIPIGTAIAQSFSEQVARNLGDIVGEEMEIFNIDYWLAPAMNIQRLPLCGRNFEYYSEDPLLTGKIASAIVKGVQSHKNKFCTVKHFACNNQETNRTNTSSNISRRAMYQIYLKGFEIVVKESNPGSVMSSYNLINGEHASESFDLQEKLLRLRWGFKNFVMSDWVVAAMVKAPKPPKKYPWAHSAKSIAAGNDLFMPGDAFDVNNLLEGLKKGVPTREKLELCASRIIDAGLR